MSDDAVKLARTFALRRHGHCGIGSQAACVCETCDKVKVSNENHHDITDYESW